MVGAAGALAAKRAKQKLAAANMFSQSNSGNTSPAIKIVTSDNPGSDIPGYSGNYHQDYPHSTNLSPNVNNLSHHNLSHTQLDHNFLQPSRSFSTTTYNTDSFETSKSQPYKELYKEVLWLNQNQPPRSWCLKMIQSDWFERASMIVIIVNCITLGMYEPDCSAEESKQQRAAGVGINGDGTSGRSSASQNFLSSHECRDTKCIVLTTIDDLIFVFFALEMIIKIVGLGVWGKKGYFADGWNRLDGFIVIASAAEYLLEVEDMNITAFRTIRVLRPLRAINRIPSLRILVMLLLDTLPMLGNVLLLCSFVFFIFGVLAVQLWAGILRQRCFIEQRWIDANLPDNHKHVHPNAAHFIKDNPHAFPKWFTGMDDDEQSDEGLVCSMRNASGMFQCGAKEMPAYSVEGKTCRLSYQFYQKGKPKDFIEYNVTLANRSHDAISRPGVKVLIEKFTKEQHCIDWNRLYTECKVVSDADFTAHRPDSLRNYPSPNPFQGSISFDNIFYAWITIFQVISLEGWVDIMYYMMDSYSFYAWTYFLLLILIGSFFMINLCLVVIATQFSETKEREERLMAEQRHKLNKSQSLKSFKDGYDSFYETVFIYIQKIYAKMKYKMYLCLVNAARRRRMPRDLAYNCGSVILSEDADNEDDGGGGLLYGSGIYDGGGDKKDDKFDRNEFDGIQGQGGQTNSYNVHYHNHYYQQHLHFHINQNGENNQNNDNFEENQDQDEPMQTSNNAAILSPDSQDSTTSNAQTSGNSIESVKTVKSKPSQNTATSSSSKSPVTRLSNQNSPNTPNSIKSIKQILSVISNSTETTPESIRKSTILSSSSTSSSTKPEFQNQTVTNESNKNDSLVALLYRAPSDLAEANAVSYILKLPQPCDSRCTTRSNDLVSAPTPHTEQLTNQALAPTVLFSNSPKLCRNSLKSTNNRMTPTYSNSFHQNGSIAPNVMTAYPQNFQNHQHFRNVQNVNLRNVTNKQSSKIQNNNNLAIQNSSSSSNTTKSTSSHHISNPSSNFSNPFTLPPTASTSYLRSANSLSATVQPLPFSRSSSSSTSASGGSGNNIKFLDAALQTEKNNNNISGSPIPTISEYHENDPPLLPHSKNNNLQLVENNFDSIDNENCEITQDSTQNSSSLTTATHSPLTESANSLTSTSTTISPVPAIPQNTPNHKINSETSPDLYSNNNQNSNNNKNTPSISSPSSIYHYNYHHHSQQNITLVTLPKSLLSSTNSNNLPEKHPESSSKVNFSSKNTNNNSNILMNHPFYESCEYNTENLTLKTSNNQPSSKNRSFHRKLFKNFSNNNNLTASSSRATFQTAGQMEKDHIADFLDGMIKFVNTFDKIVTYVQSHLESIVDSKYFGRCIMGAILVNTVSMGIEHHRQPQYLTDLLEIANIVFTTIFFLEMTAKIGAKGLFHYLQSVYNLFDAAIVIISVFEIVEGIKDPAGHAEGGSLSVLRTFRLTRVLKLIRFMPALRRQLSVLVKTIDNVATFMLLLFLFIFIFAILGMHLFGCKFCFAAGEEEMALFHQLSKDEQHLIEMQNTCGDASKRPARANFNSLLWAFVTVFQILTQEDWNLVMYNGMQTTTPLAALYFICLMTIGNYVLFNLLVAILVEGFQSADEPDDSEVDEKEKRDCSYIRIPDDIANLISCMRDASIEGHHPYDKRSAELARALSSENQNNDNKNGTRMNSPSDEGKIHFEKDNLKASKRNSVKNSARNSLNKEAFSDNVFEPEKEEKQQNQKTVKKPLLSIEAPPPTAITSQDNNKTKLETIGLKSTSLNIPFLNVVAATPSQSRAETPCLDAKSLMEKVGQKQTKISENSKEVSIPSIELPDSNNFEKNNDDSIQSPKEVQRRHSDNQSTNNMMSVPGSNNNNNPNLNLQPNSAAVFSSTMQTSFSSLSVASTQLPNNLIVSNSRDQITPTTPEPSNLNPNNLLHSQSHTPSTSNPENHNNNRLQSHHSSHHHHSHHSGGSHLDYSHGNLHSGVSPMRPGTNTTFSLLSCDSHGGKITIHDIQSVR